MSTLDSSAERLSLALAAARMGDYRWDAKTDEVIFSPRAAELAGTSPGQKLTLQQVRELVHPDDREAVSVAINRAIGERGDYSLEHRVPTALDHFACSTQGS